MRQKPPPSAIAAPEHQAGPIPHRQRRPALLTGAAPRHATTPRPPTPRSTSAATRHEAKEADWGNPETTLFLKNSTIRLKKIPILRQHRYQPFIRTYHEKTQYTTSLPGRTRCSIYLPVLARRLRQAAIQILLIRADRSNRRRTMLRKMRE